jgi:hypothetical protein
LVAPASGSRRRGFSVVAAPDPEVDFSPDVVLDEPDCEPEVDWLPLVDAAPELERAAGAWPVPEPLVDGLVEEDEPEPDELVPVLLPAAGSFAPPVLELPEGWAVDVPEEAAPELAPG